MKKVLLYSGGLDSFIADFLFKPDICLYIDVKGRYSYMELANMMDPTNGKLVCEEMANLTKYERYDDLILPQRNAFFVLQAAFHGEHIMLGATYGDRSSDKDVTFASEMEVLLNHIWKPQHWLPNGREMKVDLPLKDFTKTELVRKYLDAGGDGQILANVVSCYNGSSVACGKCKPCARKWVALKLNGIDAQFDTDPSKYFTPEMIQRARGGSYRGPKEDQEILVALGA